MSVLELKNITLPLGGKNILNNLSMVFWEGHIHAVIGPNGAGKSTLASTIMGLQGYTHHTGDILLDGQSIRELPVYERAKRGITLAWQEPARFEGLTVRQFVGAGSEDKSLERIKAVLNAMGLEPSKYIERAVDKTLSGGERKRVELASILAMGPRIVMMDEPDSGIDVEALDRIFDAFQTLKNQGTTVIAITHSLAVLNHTDHAFLVCNGAVLEKGDTHKIGGYFRDKCMPCGHTNRPEKEEIV